MMKTNTIKTLVSKGILTALVAAGTGLGITHSAQADCGVRRGKVVSVQYSGRGKTNVVVAPRGTQPGHYFHFQTTDYRYAELLASAMAGNNTIYINSRSIPRCPTTGFTRHAGEINNIVIYKND